MYPFGKSILLKIPHLMPKDEKKKCPTNKVILDLVDNVRQKMIEKEVSEFSCKKKR